MNFYGLLPVAERGSAVSVSYRGIGSANGNRRPCLSFRWVSSGAK